MKRVGWNRKRLPNKLIKPGPGNGHRKVKPKGFEPGEHLHIRVRDGMCFGAMMAAKGQVAPHVCRAQFGQIHAATDIDMLTVDHFHRHAGGTKGKKAPSDRHHGVAMCHWLNTSAPSAVIRRGEREYMTWLEATGRV